MLEKAVNGLLSEDYEKVTAGHFFELRDQHQPIFTEQCSIGQDIYGKRRRVDFILYHPERWPDCLVIQCKWQASSGSVEEKYPFEVLSIQLSEFDTIIVLDGGGYSQGAERWLKGQASEVPDHQSGHGGGSEIWRMGQSNRNKLLHVLNLGEISRFHSQGRL